MCSKRVKNIKKAIGFLILTLVFAGVFAMMVEEHGLLQATAALVGSVVLAGLIFLGIRLID